MGLHLAAFHINQNKLVQILGSIQTMFFVGWRLCQIYEMSKLSLGQASHCKVWVRPIHKENLENTHLTFFWENLLRRQEL